MPLFRSDSPAPGPRLHGPKPEAQGVRPAQSPGAGLFLARRGHGAEDEPGHPAGAGVPGDRLPAWRGTGGRGGGRRGGSKLTAGVQFLRSILPF